MKNKPAEPSPLEKLVKAAQDKELHEKAARKKAASKNLPVKLQPKNRLEPKVLIPLVEDDGSKDQLTLVEDVSNIAKEIPGGVVVANSSLTLNFNFNVDDKAVDRAIQTSKQVAKGIAAAGAAMLGTAFLFNQNNKVVDKVKIPLTPNPKISKNAPKSNKG